MTMRMRILAAALLTLGAGAGYWMYQAWPSWYGSDVEFEVSVGRREARTGRVSLEFPASRLKLEVPGAAVDESPVPAYVVRQIGEVWPAGADAARGARRLHGRMVYVQIARGPSKPEGPYVPGAEGPYVPGAEGPYVPGADGAYVPVSVSLTPVDGATNFHVLVVDVAPTGRFRIALGPPVYPVPTSFIDTASFSAAFRVLPSGRHAMVGLVAR